MGRGVKLDFRHLPNGRMVSAATVEAELIRIGHDLRIDFRRADLCLFYQSRRQLVKSQLGDDARLSGIAAIATGLGCKGAVRGQGAGAYRIDCLAFFALVLCGLCYGGRRATLCPPAPILSG